MSNWWQTGFGTVLAKGPSHPLRNGGPVTAGGLADPIVLVVGHDDLQPHTHGLRVFMPNTEFKCAMRELPAWGASGNQTILSG